MSNQKTIAFDLDEVLCTRPDGIEYLGIDKYLHNTPDQYNIDLMNEYYDQGYTIVIYTARGMTSLNGDVSMIYAKLYNLTHEQLKRWGAKFHTLVMGKIHYDVLIDDKAVNSEHDNLKTLVDNVLRNGII